MEEPQPALPLELLLEESREFVPPALPLGLS